jgi:hypothetical protein
MFGLYFQNVYICQNFKTMSETKQLPPLTIAPELFEAWKKAKRKGDSTEMAKTLGVSKPVIDRALLYGNVTMVGLSEKVTKYFEDRLKKEREAAGRLNSLSTTTTDIDKKANAEEREAKREF